MKRYIYIRVSSEKQSYEQQKECILQYFERHGIDPKIVDEEILEKEHGDVEHTERKLSDLVNVCESGDILYISELSRIGRSMKDLFDSVGKLSQKGKKEAAAEEKRTGKKQPYGVTIIQCKDGTTIESESIGGKSILFALGLAAEIELENIRMRTRMAMAALKRQIEEQGYFIAKRSGERRTHLGRIYGEGMPDGATLAAADRNAERYVDWCESSPAYKYAEEKIKAGWSNAEILRELEILEQTNPGMYLSRMGKKIGRMQLSRWRDRIMPQPTKTIVRHQKRKTSRSRKQ